MDALHTPLNDPEVPQQTVSGRDVIPDAREGSLPRRCEKGRMAALVRSF